MATLRAAVEAVSGVTWLSGAPVVATVGAAWDDGVLHVVLSVPRTARPGYMDPVIAAASITSALAAVPGYTTSTAVEVTWTFGGRAALVGRWTPSAVLTGDPTVPTAASGDADTSAASTGFVASAVAAQASTDSGTYAASADGPAILSAAHTTDNISVQFASNWGVNSLGNVYHDTAGAVAGEEAVVSFGSTGNLSAVKIMH